MTDTTITDVNVPEEKPHHGVIFAIDRDFITKGLKCKQGLNALDKSVLDEFEPHLVMKRRKTLEKDRRFLQLLPYYIFLRKNEAGEVKEGYFYRRTQGVGENRLAGKYSFGWGGHIDITALSLDENKNFDIHTIIKNNSLEELEQELGMDEANVERLIEMRAEFQGLLTDFSDDVGNVHLGLVYVVVLDHDEDFAFSSKEDELAHVGWVELEGLFKPEGLEMYNELESWTTISLNHILLRYVVGADNERINQVVDKFDQMAANSGLHVTADHSDVLIPQLGLDEEISDRVLGFAVSVAMAVVSEVGAKAAKYMPGQTAQEVRELAAPNLELYYKHAGAIKNELQRVPAGN